MQTFLLWTALITSIVGLTLLTLMKPDVSPQLLELQGEVIGVEQYEKVAFINFKPEELIVVSFDDIPTTGQQTLRGRLKQYKGKLEFVLDD